MSHECEHPDCQEEGVEQLGDCWWCSEHASDTHCSTCGDPIVHGAEAFAPVVVEHEHLDPEGPVYCKKACIPEENYHG